MQFGHAGALAQGNLETSDAKNKALAAAGAYVPSSFADMGPLLKALYDKLVSEGTIVPEKDGPVPKVSACLFADNSQTNKQTNRQCNQAKRRPTCRRLVATYVVDEWAIVSLFSDFLTPPTPPLHPYPHH